VTVFVTVAFPQIFEQTGWFVGVQTLSRTSLQLSEVDLADSLSSEKSESETERFSDREMLITERGKKCDYKIWMKSVVFFSII